MGVLKNPPRNVEKPLHSSGSEVALGVSAREKITEKPEDLGQGRNEDTGKPMGPQRKSLWGGAKTA